MMSLVTNFIINLLKIKSVSLILHVYICMKRFVMTGAYYDVALIQMYYDVACYFIFLMNT